MIVIWVCLILRNADGSGCQIKLHELDTATLLCVCMCERTAKWVRKLIPWFPVERARPLSSISEISSVVRIRGHITYFSSTLILVLLGHHLTQTRQDIRRAFLSTLGRSTVVACNTIFTSSAFIIIDFIQTVFSVGL